MGRNSLRLPAMTTVDLRVLKSFNVPPHGKLDVVVEALNLLNRTNVSQLTKVFGISTTPLPTCGEPIKAALARRVEFSIDFEF